MSESKRRLQAENDEIHRAIIKLVDFRDAVKSAVVKMRTGRPYEGLKEIDDAIAALEPPKVEPPPETQRLERLTDHHRAVRRHRVLGLLAGLALVGPISQGRR